MNDDHHHYYHSHNPQPRVEHDQCVCLVYHHNMMMVLIRFMQSLWDTKNMRGERLKRHVKKFVESGFIYSWTSHEIMRLKKQIDLSWEREVEREKERGKG